jgi:glyoxylase-like metal-dependent hydrolase (beta-lactamase superfamily II)
MRTLVSRRGFLASTAMLAGASLVERRMLFGQDSTLPTVMLQGRANGAKAKIATQKLRGSVSALTGSGGNIAVLVGADGAVLVDSSFATSQPQITEALAGLNAGPVKHLINTHWHFDHTDGNEWMHAGGATIVAQEKTKERLSTPQYIGAFKAQFPASPAGAIPRFTFVKGDAMTLNGEALKLEHYDPAHTDTDAWVYFPAADVLHVGDTWFNGFYPFIDYSTGGSIDGMIKATEKNLAFASAKTIIIPGHGAIGDKAQLTEFHEMLAGCRANVAALKKQGKTLEETVAAKPTAAYDAKFGQKPETFVGLVYQGV